MFNRTVPFLALLAVAMWTPAQAQDAAAQASVTGIWEMSWETPRGPMTMQFELKQDGDALTGRVQTRGGWREIEDGKTDGTTFSFVLEVARQNQTFSMQYKGSLQDDGTLKGTITTPRGENPWTAKRVES